MSDSLLQHTNSSLLERQTAEAGKYAQAGGQTDRHRQTDTDRQTEMERDRDQEKYSIVPGCL